MSADAGDRAVPGWSLPRGLIVVLGVAGAVVAVAGMKAFASVLGPTFLALMLTIAVSPVQGWLRRNGSPRWLAVLTAIVVVNAILIGLVLALAISIEQLVTILPDYAGKAQDLLDGLHNLLTGWGVGSGHAKDLLAHIDPQRLLHLVVDLTSGLLGAGSYLVFLLALLLFMAVDATGFVDQMSVAAGQRPHIIEGLTSFGAGVRSYLVVSTVFGLIVAVLDGIALWALGVPLPILWGLLAFITNYIPNIGFVIGLAPPALLALLDGGPSLMLWVIVVYSVLNVVIQSVIQPKFVGDAVGLSVTLTFLSLVFWSWVLGPLGAILAVPLSLFVKALLIDIDPSARWLSGMISGGPPAKDTPIQDAADGDPDPDPAAVQPETTADTAAATEDEAEE
ncbi:AI-2E family transporter [Speluncibacter jeojiensis]|uniref:AI-2E family transporter n=1 Tax=Speluncibacter jeojiensis TaxID=2710754 RepID=A0A9X4M5M3_9ACTN|nr:AI-2E family transporter [Corynebacteriales bacterium D3-21]